MLNKVLWVFFAVAFGTLGLMLAKELQEKKLTDAIFKMQRSVETCCEK